ncbi:MAG: NAD-dependent epimerase/dehydratase family protein [Chloroflexi bacterium]|nr:NAD-dependent epimerase/dehydratase family protein [Chloroflexota bacterium]
MLTAFVTGVNSFLGATLARELLAQGWRVRGLLRAESNDILLQGLAIERVIGDLLQPETYRSALQGCDALFHVAAMYTHAPQDLALMKAVNQEGVRLILASAQACGVSRMIHTSTIGTIGQPERGLADETIPFNLPAPSPYVLSKLAGERIADEFAARGAHVVIVHPTGMLGAGDWRPTASGKLVLAALRGRRLNYPAGGVNWCPVQDVAKGMILALEKGRPGRHYILGHAQGNLDYEAFVALVHRAADDRLFSKTLQSVRNRITRPFHRTQFSGGPQRLTCNPARAIRELNMPQSDLLAAARASVRWYRAQGRL